MSPNGFLATIQGIFENDQNLDKQHKVDIVKRYLIELENFVDLMKDVGATKEEIIEYLDLAKQNYF